MIPWAAIAQAVQLGLQATKTYMDYKNSKKKSQDTGYDEGSDDAFGGRVFQAYAQKDGPAPDTGEDSWMQRIPEIAKVMTSFRGNASPSQYPPMPELAPVAPSAGISANPMNIPPATRLPFESRPASPTYPSDSVPSYIRLRDILERYRLR